MGVPGTRRSRSIAAIVEAERVARHQLMEAEASGQGPEVIDEFAHTWRAVLSTLLEAYSAPANWRRGVPRRSLPQDVAAVLGRQIRTIAAAETELASTLTSASNEFVRERKNGGDGRSSVCASLNALFRYLAVVRPSRRGQLQPLTTLGVGLDDLQAGRATDPMFLPAQRKGGRRKAPLSHAVLHQIAAVAVAILMDDHEFEPDGRKRKKAANAYVSRKLERIGWKYSPETVGNWRSQVTSHLPRGVGSPRKPDHVRPSPAQSKDQVQTYLRIWYYWRDRDRHGLSARDFADRLIGSDVGIIRP